MTLSLRTPPLPDEIEVSVFGPGFGEAILIHIGKNQWVIVDSCKAKDAQLPAPIDYLNSLGIPPQNHVVMICASHWHADHINGLHQIVQACPNTPVVLSGAITPKEFQVWIDLERHVAPARKQRRALDELFDILEHFNVKKNVGLKIALENKALSSWAAAMGSLCTITALSPSDSAFIEIKKELARIQPKIGDQPDGIPPINPNFAAVVLWVSIGDLNILLGADLEEHPKFSGWSSLIASSVKPTGRADVYKVAHHGSKTSHHMPIWTTLLNANPLAMLTPWVAGGSALPNRDVAASISGLTDQAFLSSYPIPKPKRLQGAAEKAHDQRKRNLRTINRPMGHIRARKNLASPGASWQVELFGNAMSLSRAVQIIDRHLARKKR